MGGAPSSEHCRTASGSSTLMLNVALVLSVPDCGVGGEIDTTGGVMSPIAQPYSAGDGSALPSPSTARTEKSWSPKARSLYTSPELQGT